MYGGVPGAASVDSHEPLNGNAAPASAGAYRSVFAMPKSSSFAPDLVSMTLPGFRSR